MATRSGRRLTRRDFLRLGVGATAGAAMMGALGQFGTCADRKPNILFILPDQLRAASLGCMGDPEVRTPNINRLAKQGMVFTDAISNYPVCTPYRAALLTGRFPSATGVATNGVELPDGEVTIAEVLKDQGYKTGYIGKWHLEKNGDPFVPKNRRQGFDYWAVCNTGGKHYDWFYCGDTPDQKPLKGYVPDGQTKLAVEFMEKNKANPFCLFLSYGPPHPAYDPPKEYADLYDAKKLKQRPNVPNDSYRETLALYNGSISAIDANVGRLMDSLDKLGIAEDTIVVFTSDHGDMMGSHDRIGKNVPWEEAINVPFVVRYPRKVKAGSKTDALISAVDIMPTLLSLCGAPVPKPVQGTDMSGFALGKGSAKPESVLLQRVFSGREKGLAVREWRGVRTNRYTYARSRDKAWLLYDNEKDPYQMNNLADRSEAKAVQEKLEADLQGWLKRVGDDFASSDEWKKRVAGRCSRKLGRME